MCNLSQGVAERAMEKGENRATLTAIQNIMKNANLTADKAMDMLGIAQADRAKYKEQLRS